MPVITCPGCAVKLKVPDGLNAAAKCPKCQSLLAPTASPAFEVVEDAPPKTAPKPLPKPKPASKPDLEPVEAERLERPAVRKRKGVEVDESEDDRPRKKPRRYDEDEDDDAPRRKGAEVDESEDDRPRKKARRYDEEDDAPPKRSKKPRGADQPGGVNRGLVFGAIAVWGLVLVLGCVLGVQYATMDTSFAGVWPDPKPLGGGAATDTVTLHILNVDGNGTAEAISERLADIPPVERGRSASWSGGRMTVLIAPVKDAEEFAKQINFGRVHSVKGNVICIYADKLEAPSTDPVAKALRDLGRASPHGKSSAVMTLSHTPPNDRRAEVLKALEPLLDDTDTGRRDLAGRAYCAWATADNTPTVIKLLKRDSTRAKAAEALGRFKDERAIVPLTEYAGDFFSQREVKEALLAFGPAAEGAVIKMLDNSDRNIRAVGCELLQKIGTARAMDPLAACFVRPESRMQAEAALVSFGPAAEDAVIKLLDNSDRNVRLQACRMLIKIGTTKCLPALERTAKDPERNVSSTAKNAIQQINQRLSPKS